MRKDAVDRVDRVDRGTRKSRAQKDGSYVEARPPTKPIQRAMTRGRKGGTQPASTTKVVQLIQARPIQGGQTQLTSTVEAYTGSKKLPGWNALRKLGSQGAILDHLAQEYGLVLEPPDIEGQYIALLRKQYATDGQNDVAV